MGRCPTLDEIRIALFKKAMEAIEPLRERVFLTAPAQDADPDLRQMILFATYIPGEVIRAELGGSGALAERHGFWKMTVSTLPDNNADEPWALAEMLEAAFRPYTLDGLPVTEIEDEVSPVFCEFPYTENIGQLPDGRIGITVTVPWWTWTQN